MRTQTSKPFRYVSVAAPECGGRLLLTEHVATDTQPRPCKSPCIRLSRSVPNLKWLLTSPPAIPRLGHAEPLVGLWRRHRHSNRQVHPPHPRQALARRLAVLAGAFDSYKLGGALNLLCPYKPSKQLTRVGRIRIQDPRPGQPFWRWLRVVAHQAASTTRACLWSCR